VGWQALPGWGTYDSWILKIDLPSFHQSIKRNLTGTHMRLIDLGLRLKVYFGSLKAQTPSTTEEDVGGGCFRKEE
jgi:hypothetical protein